jgi:hypothetical protein
LSSPAGHAETNSPRAYVVRSTSVSQRPGGVSRKSRLKSGCSRSMLCARQTNHLCCCLASSAKVPRGLYGAVLDPPWPDTPGVRDFLHEPEVRPPRKVKPARLLLPSRRQIRNISRETELVTGEATPSTFPNTAVSPHHVASAAFRSASNAFPWASVGTLQACSRCLQAATGFSAPS